MFDSTIQQLQQLTQQLSQAEARHAQQLSMLAQEESRASSQLQHVTNQLSQLIWQISQTTSASPYATTQPQWTPSSGHGTQQYNQLTGSMPSFASSAASQGFLPQTDQFGRPQSPGSMPSSQTTQYWPGSSQGHV